MLEAQGAAASAHAQTLILIIVQIALDQLLAVDRGRGRDKK